MNPRYTYIKFENYGELMFAPKSIWAWNIFAKKRGFAKTATLDAIAAELGKVVSTDKDGNISVDVLTAPTILADWLSSSHIAACQMCKTTAHDDTDVMLWVEECFANPEKMTEVIAALMGGEETGAKKKGRQKASHLTTS